MKKIVMKTKGLLFTAGLALATAFTLFGCSTQTSNNLRALELTPKTFPATPMVADLDVAAKKALGQAKGKVVYKRDLEQEAIAAALKQSNADVLVVPSYFYAQKGSELTVTVLGYPARYKNFKPKEIPDPPDSKDILVGGNFFYEDGDNNLQVIVKSTKPDAPQEPTAEQKPAAEQKPETPVEALPEENIQ